MGRLYSFFAATNGILQGCPLSVILISLLTSIWKKVLDVQKHATQISATILHPGGGKVCVYVRVFVVCCLRLFKF